MKKILWVWAVAVVFAGAVSEPLQAASTPEATQWLEKMAAAYAKGPYTVNYSGSLTMEQMGQALNMEMNGSLTQDGPGRQKTDITMKMTGMPGMDAPVEMKTVLVSDGETLWMEMAHPMMGQRVMKIGLDQIEELSGDSAKIFGGDPLSMDPVNQVRKLAEALDLDVGSIADGKVTLTAEMTEEAVAAAGGSLPPGLSRLTLILDEKTAMPTQVRVGGDGEGGMTMNFSGMRYLEKKPSFEYQPPEGVEVMDLGAMAAVGAGAGGN